MAARWRGGLGTVLHSGTNLASFSGALLEVVWRDRQPERAEPKSFILFQDAQLSGSAVVSTPPSQEGAHLGTAYAESSNEGDLLPYVSGGWDTTAGTGQPVPADLELQVVRTGSLYQSSEWGWKYSTDAADQWRGMDDMRWLHSPHCPFGDSADRGSCLSLCHSRLHNKIIAAYHPTGTNEMKVCTRSAATGSGESWDAPSTINFSPKKSPDNNGYSAMWELPDGSLRWAFSVVPDSGSPNLRDIDIYGSTDGGTSWELVKESVVTELMGSTRELQKFSVAISGDWMRLEMYLLDSTPAGIVSATSADRCATWQLVGDGVPDGYDDRLSNLDTNNGYEAWDVASIDDNGGFIRVRGFNDGGADRLQYELASRDGVWSRVSRTEGGLFQPLSQTEGYAVFLARGGGRIWVLVFDSDHNSGSPAGEDFWAVGSFIIPEPLVNGGWISTEPRIDRWSRWGADDWLGYGGIARIHPKNGRLAWLGDRLGFIHTGVDRQTGTTSSDQQTPSVRYIGGSSRRPLRLPQAENVDLMDSMLTLWWESGLGGIGTAPTTSTFDPWTEALASGTKTWTPAYMQISMNSNNDYWQSNTLLSGLTQQRVCDAGVFLWSTRSEPNTDGDTSWPPASANFGSPLWGAVMKSSSLITAGLTLSVSVHIDGQTGTFGVFDVAAGTTLWASASGALAGITTGTWYNFRLGCAHSDTIGRAGTSSLFVELAAAEAGDSQWVSSGLLTVSGGAASFSTEQVQFGHFRTVSSSGLTVQWREAGYRRGDTLGQVDFSNPEDLRGWACLPHTMRVGQAHDVLWGGAGGFKGDQYNCPVRYEYGVEQLLLDTPASQWRSDSTTTQTISLDATLLEDDSNARFLHSGFAGISTNSRYFQVEYSDSSNFDNPVRITVDGKRYQGQVLDVAEPVHVKLEGDWQDGELAGHYLRAVGGSPSNAPIARITGNAGSWVHLTGITSTLAAWGLGTGSTVVLWGTQHLHAYSEHPEGVRVINAAGGVDGAFPRYMRITVPGNESQGEPPEGYWQVGRLQAGLTMPFNVPLDWSDSDDEQPNVDLQTMSSGVRVAYEAGAPRRIIRGTTQGDVSRWRTAFRSMVKLLGGYSKKPLVLCRDDLNQNLSAIYCRFTDSTEFANQGWRYDLETERWVRVGDLSVTFDQEV